MKKIICYTLLILLTLTLQSCSDNNIVGAGNQTQEQQSDFVGTWNINSLGSHLHSVSFEIHLTNDTLINSIVSKDDLKIADLNGYVFNEAIWLSFEYQSQLFNLKSEYNQMDSTMYGIGSTNSESFHWLASKK